MQLLQTGPCYLMCLEMGVVKQLQCHAEMRFDCMGCFLFFVLND